MACAIAQYACRNGFAVKYYKLSKLLEILHISKADGSYLELIIKVEKFNCLIFVDRGIEPISEQRHNNILDIIDDLYQKGSIVITSPLPLEHWHDYIGAPMIADAILDWLINYAIIIKLDRDSMLKNAWSMSIIMFN